MAINAQDLKTVRDEKNDTDMLVGIARRSNITEGQYAEWYTNEYDGYQGDEGIISASKDFLDQQKHKYFPTDADKNSTEKFAENNLIKLISIRDLFSKNIVKSIFSF